MTTTAQQINQRDNPFGYQTKRTSYAAPVVGLPYLVTFGPRTVTTAAAPIGAQRIDIPFRVSAIAWSATLGAGLSAAVLRVFVHNAHTSGVPSGQSLLHNIDVFANPTGIAYFRDTAAAFSIPDRAGSSNGSNTHPYAFGQSANNVSYLKMAVATLTGGNLVDLYVAVFGWTCDYMNSLSGGLFKAMPPEVD